MIDPIPHPSYCQRPAMRLTWMVAPAWHRLAGRAGRARPFTTSPAKLSYRFDSQTTRRDLPFQAPRAGRLGGLLARAGRLLIHS